jgi:transposase InsO family protein
MSRARKPADNTICERFVRTFKTEESELGFITVKSTPGNQSHVTSNKLKTIADFTQASDIDRQQNSKLCPLNQPLRSF